MPVVTTLEHATALHEALQDRSATVAAAESLTGGAVSDVLSAAPGASQTFLGGIVSYATEVKTGLLGVSEETVAEQGVVSRQCAAEMAEGARRLFGSDLAVSTTGVAGPDTQEGKPVGLVYVAVAGDSGANVVELNLDGDRPEIRRQTVDAAIAALLARLGADSAPGGEAGD
jgi:nicotinamide-nucleotide amidase